MYINRKRTGCFGFRAVILTAALILLMGSAVSGTIAWMFVNAEPVENTFVYSDIKIELTETDTKDDDDIRTNTYTFTAGSVIAKDPQVTVKAGSESCWLFAEVVKGGAFDDWLAYEAADGWTPLEGEPDVYYRKVDAAGYDQTFTVLRDNVVKVNGALTQEDMETLTVGEFPTMQVKAYAVQQFKVDTPAEAWKITDTETHLQDVSTAYKNVFDPVQIDDHDLDIKVTGKCVLLGRDWQEGDAFLFMLQMWDEEEQKWETLGTESVTQDDGSGCGIFDFNHLVSQHLTEEKYYFFRIVEGQGNLAGINYDKGIREFAVHVVTDDSGIMSISEVLNMENTEIAWNEESGSYEVAVEFINTYVKPHEPPVIPDPEDINVDINISKIVKNLGAGVAGPEGFEFQLEKNSTGQVWFAVSDRDGRAVFHMNYGSHDAGKVFIYKLSEVDGGQPGITYDQREYDIRVRIVLDEAANRLIPTITVDGMEVDEAALEFKNVYESDEDPAKPTEPSDPTDPSEPGQPTEPSEPGQPSDPTEPTDPSEPTQPTDPSYPTRPTEPSEPAQPTEPSDPVEPSEPSDPVEPSEPSQPTDPTDPIDPWYPTGPDEPTEPTDPSDPADPWYPTDPSDPSVPDVPTDPIGPTFPSTPDLPLDSDTQTAGTDDNSADDNRDHGTQTGDNFTIFLYLILLLTSSVIMIVLLASPRKIEHQRR